MTDKILHSNECLEVVQKSLRQNSMKNYSLVTHEILPIDKCAGYMGQYFHLKATVVNSSNVRKINFFIKRHPPQGTRQFDVLSKTGVFNREIQLYTKLFPLIFDQLHHYIPVCFLGIEDNILVLEDMVSKGFVMLDNKFFTFDFPHCEIVMETLGMFHSQSIIFEERNKMNLVEFCREMRIDIEPNNDSEEGVSALYKTLTHGILYCTENNFQFDSATCGKFHDVFLNVVSNMKDIIAMKGRKVQDHGDLWSNNMMFKYDDGKPVKCCFIDFQTTRYTSPARDILIFLYYTTTRAFRIENSEKLLKIYYDSLAKCLAEVNMDIWEIYPWEEFLESIANFRLYSLIRVIYILPIAFSDLKTNEDSDSGSEIWDHLLNHPFALSNQLVENERLRSRLLDLLLDLQDLL